MSNMDRFRSDFVLALTLAAVLLVGGLFAVVLISLWQYVQLISLATLLIGVSFVVVRGVMMWQHHQIALEAKRNQALLVHESEHGFGYVDDGKVIGYTHTASGRLPMPQYDMPPLLPNLHPGPSTMVLDAPVEPEIPATFEEMVKSGHVAPGLDYTVAYDEETGEPIRMPALTSLGVGGGQGFGKTVTTLSLMLQTVIKYNGKVRFLVMDPHKYVDNDESLASKVADLYPFFLTVQDVRTTVPQDDQEYTDALDLADRAGLSSIIGGEDELAGWLHIIGLEMKRRLAGKSGDMWVVVVDEFAALMAGDLSKSIAGLLEKINQQARKVGMFALLISQEWKATRTGGSELRHSIVSFIAHNMPVQISELVLPADVARQTPTLDVGRVLVWSRGKVRRGKVPYASGEDARRVVELYHPRSLVKVSEVVTSGTEVKE